MKLSFTPLEYDVGGVEILSTRVFELFDLDEKLKILYKTVD